MVDFENTTIKLLHKINFRSKVINFVLGYILRSEKYFFKMKKNTLPSVPKWNFSKSVPLETFVT